MQPTPTPLPTPDDFSARVRRGLRNKCYIVPREAKRDRGPWITVRGVSGGLVENVKILDPAPQSEVHPHSELIAFEDCTDLRVRGLSVSGGGHWGCVVRGGRNLDFEGVRGNRCMVAFKVDSQKAPTVGFRLSNARFWDGWNPHHDVTPESRIRAGERMGWNGFNLHGVVDGLVEHVVIGGETGGCKMTTCRHVRMRDSVIPGMHLMGVQHHETGNAAHHWTPGTEGSYDQVLERVLVWQRMCDSVIHEDPRWEPTEEQVDYSNGIQVSKHSEVRIVDCDLRADGSHGHAIQAALGARVHVEGGFIAGWNGIRGVTPAAAFDLRPHEGDGSRITYDGVQFADQERIWSERTPVERRT